MDTLFHAPFYLFQSTLPVRGATEGRNIRVYGTKKFQSTLPVRGATFIRGYAVRRERGISIHAPRAGSDAVSAAPLAGREISIHAPRAGSDETYT